VGIVWLQHIKKQSGSATMLALLGMLILGASAGTYMVSSGAGLGNGNNYGETVAAQYAAEAGITYAMTHAKQNTPTSTGTWDRSTISGSPIALDSSNAQSPTFTITITSQTPKPTNYNGDYFKITSTGKVGSTKRSVVAYITIPSPVNPTPASTFDLMNDADYSGTKWTQGTDFVTAPSGIYCQVLFKDAIYANDANHKDALGNKGFTLNYNVNLVSTNAGHDNDSGYGIYYLATGNADNMSAYVLQYDPGLSPDQILVKKVIASRNSTTNPWENEVFGGTNNSFQGSMNDSGTKKNPSISPSWTNTTLNNVNLSSQDLMTIPMADVLNKLNQLNINSTNNNKMKGQNHRLTIDARPDANGKVVHTISMDGLQILKFIDRGGNGVPFTQGSTGLRVWQAQAQFYNNTNPGGGDVTSGQVGSIQIRSWGSEKL